MTTRRTNRLGSAAIAACVVLTTASTASAGTCSVKITWAPTTGGSASHTIQITSGATDDVDQNGMLRVKNRGSDPIRIYLSIGGAPELNRTLQPGESDPPGGINYAPYHTLTRVKCLEGGGGGTPLTPAGLVAALQAQGVSVEQILTQVKTNFNLNASQLVALARQTHLDVVLSAQAVKNLYGATQSQLASWHFDAGYSAQTVAIVLRTVLQATAVQIAGLLEDHNLSCVQTLTAVVAAIQGLTADAAAVALKGAGYDPGEVLGALTQVLGVTTQVAAAAVMAAGYSPTLAVQAIATVISSTQQLTQIVYENVDLGQIILTQATEALQQAGVTRDIAYQAMVAAARWAQVLIDSVLDHVFGPAPAAPVGSAADWDAWRQAAAAAARTEARAWIANIAVDKRRCTVNGPVASGRAGILRSSESVGGGVERVLQHAGAPAEIARAWDKAFRDAWNEWARGLSLPGVPWYPSLLNWPGAQAPPQPNVPTPLETFISPGAAAMTPHGLSARLADRLGDPASEPGAVVAIQAFATELGERFAVCLSTCQVSTVMGAGPVPAYHPPAVPTGPVVAGSCWGGVILANPY